MFRDVLGAGRRVCPAGAMGPGWDSIEPALQQAVQRMRQRQIDWLTMMIGQLKPKAGKADARAPRQPTSSQLAAQVFAQCQGGLLSARISGRASDFDDALAPLMLALQLSPTN
jgi:TetR/AcrR family transcriptional repressor of nem operon